MCLYHRIVDTRFFTTMANEGLLIFLEIKHTVTLATDWMILAFNTILKLLLAIYRNWWQFNLYPIYLLWLPHEMGRHYVFMLILKFFDLSENFYRSGRVTMSTLRIRGCQSVCPSVCRQIKQTSTQKVTSLFSIFIYIWIKQDVEKKIMKRNF